MALEDANGGTLIWAFWGFVFWQATFTSTEILTRVRNEKLVKGWEGFVCHTGICKTVTGWRRTLEMLNLTASEFELIWMKNDTQLLACFIAFYWDVWKSPGPTSKKSQSNVFKSVTWPAKMWMMSKGAPTVVSRDILNKRIKWWTFVAGQCYPASWGHWLKIKMGDIKVPQKWS